MNEFMNDLEKSCPVCSGKGAVTQDDVYELREGFNLVKSKRLKMEMNKPNFKAGMSNMELEYSKYLDVAVDSIESNSGNCKHCNGTGIVNTKFGILLLDFLARNKGKF